ncbi:unnamed protein product [Cuscuta epithymum]|uniref:Uncharacterized protein n=1 Tax=Cuscuta epithymum TaxID=186058 RepID=A0AAV0BY86_9ASTE|nr:unnamed protein product [Cuscuta epithymum]
MSLTDRPPPASSSSSALVLSASREVDPLLKDLSEKKQSFRRSVVSLAAELKEVRGRLASQAQSFARETLTRQEAESRAKKMEEEINILQKNLEQKNWQIQASTSTAEKYLREVDDLRCKLSATQATADASAETAQAVQMQCLELIKELNEKSKSLKEHEDCISKLKEQLNLLQKDLQARASSQMQLKHQVLRIENDIRQALAKEFDEEVSPMRFKKIVELLSVKDQEIAKMRDDIKTMSAHWELKTKELESQLEKRQRADQQLKKRVTKLEFCVQEARAKLRMMGERQDETLKEIRDKLASKQNGTSSNENPNFWEKSGFKIVVSMSMLVLVLFTKR